MNFENNLNQISKKVVKPQKSKLSITIKQKYIDYINQIIEIHDIEDNAKNRATIVENIFEKANLEKYIKDKIEDKGEKQADKDAKNKSVDKKIAEHYPKKEGNSYKSNSLVADYDDL